MTPEQPSTTSSPDRAGTGRPSTLSPFLLGRDTLSLDALGEVTHGKRGVALAPEAKERVVRARREVARLVDGGANTPNVYGVNTGFGALAEVRISPAQLTELQQNLVRSHAAGVGEPLPAPAVRAMMLLRAQVLAMGHSGATLEVVTLLLAMLERHVHPVIPRRGSVGASGDLAPLAHLALVVMGEGEATVGEDKTVLSGSEALAKVGLSPCTLGAKEGLSLVNGTQLMTAVGALAISDAKRLAKIADIAGALSLEALMGTPRAFDPRISAVRPHPGQAESADNLRALLAGSQIAASHTGCGKVQDPYSLRCMPQVHGASRDTFTYAQSVLEREMASATDNPLLFFGEGDPNASAADTEVIFLSGGNFHGQPVALVLDFAAIAAAELANIAERRIEQLVNPHLSGLPPFLVADSGLNSGYMMAQVTAAALVSENKVLCHPASCDSIPSSAGREDHVSMGTTSALKLTQVVEATRTVLAIELLCAVQGVDLRQPLRSTPALEAVRSAVRAEVPHYDKDRPMHRDIEKVRRMLEGSQLIDVAQEHLSVQFR